MIIIISFILLLTPLLNLSIFTKTRTCCCRFLNEDAILKMCMDEQQKKKEKKEKHKKILLYTPATDIEVVKK